MPDGGGLQGVGVHHGVGIELAGEGGDCVPTRFGEGEEATDGVFEFLRVGHPRGADAGARRGRDEVADAVTDVRLHGHDRHAEVGFEVAHVDLDALLLGLIHEVQRHDHGDAELGKFQREGQVARQVRGVQDVHDQGAWVGEESGEENLLVRCAAGEGVGAREVDEFHVTAGEVRVGVREVERRAAPVADLERAACKGVDEAGLAGVGGSDHEPAPGSGAVGCGATRAGERTARLEATEPAGHARPLPFVWVGRGRRPLRWHAPSGEPNLPGDGGDPRLGFDRGLRRGARSHAEGEQRRTMRGAPQSRTTRAGRPHAIASRPQSPQPRPMVRRVAWILEPQARVS